MARGSCSTCMEATAVRQRSSLPPAWQTIICPSKLSLAEVLPQTHPKAGKLTEQYEKEMEEFKKTEDKQSLCACGRAESDTLSDEPRVWGCPWGTAFGSCSIRWNQARVSVRDRTHRSRSRGSCHRSGGGAKPGERVGRNLAPESALVARIGTRSRATGGNLKEEAEVGERDSLRTVRTHAAG